MAITWKFWPPIVAWRRSRDGISRIQGAHQVAQKLINKTLPRNEFSVTVSPAPFCMAISGTGRGVSLRINCSIQPVSGGLSATACLAGVKAIIAIAKIAVRLNCLTTHHVDLSE